MIYERERNGSKVVVFLNLSAKTQKVMVPSSLAGAYVNLFADKKELLKEKQNISLAPWGYAVYVR